MGDKASHIPPLLTKRMSAPSAMDRDPGFSEPSLADADSYFWPPELDVGKAARGSHASTVKEADQFEVVHLSLTWRCHSSPATSNWRKGSIHGSLNNTDRQALSN